LIFDSIGLDSIPLLLLLLLPKDINKLARRSSDQQISRSTDQCN